MGRVDVNDLKLKVEVEIVARYFVPNKVRVFDIRVQFTHKVFEQLLL